MEKPRFWKSVIPLLLSPLFLSAQLPVKGRVVDEENAPLPGVNILILEAETGTVTDEAGAFLIQVPDKPPVTLQFSFVGYQTRTIPLKDKADLLVQLLPKAEELDEFVVIGYGTRVRRKLTSSVASVESKVFEAYPDQNFQGALAGQIPGVRVLQNSGVIGSQVLFRVRGVSSVSAGNQPLLVIDGLILSNRLEGFGLGGEGANPFINIDPNEIESIEVLKDAAAAAIYGSRGANGVILITTKSGRFHAKPQVRISAMAGFSDPTRKPEVLTGPDYASLWNRAAEASDIPESSGAYYDVDQQVNTNWLDLISQRGWQQQYTAQVSGGTDRTSYFISGGFKDQDGLIRRTNLKRYSFRANIEQMIGDKVTAGLNVAPSRTHNQRLPEEANFNAPYTYAQVFFPNVNAYDEAGRPAGGLLPTDIGFTLAPGSPLVNLEEIDILQLRTQVLLNTFLSYRPLKQLELRTDLGVESSQLREDLKASSRTGMGYGTNGYGAALSQDVMNYNWTAQAIVVSAVVHLASLCWRGAFVRP